MLKQTISATGRGQNEVLKKDRTEYRAEDRADENIRQTGRRRYKKTE